MCNLYSARRDGPAWDIRWSTAYTLVGYATQDSGQSDGYAVQVFTCQ
jgi:hypothetical protein